MNRITIPRTLEAYVLELGLSGHIGVIGLTFNLVQLILIHEQSLVIVFKNLIYRIHYNVTAAAVMIFVNLHDGRRDWVEIDQIFQCFVGVISHNCLLNIDNKSYTIPFYNVRIN